MKPLQLKFIKSAAKFEQLPEDQGCEIVFIGYSNVGKSSLINKICHQKSMAKISRTPGRTQLFNIFDYTENSRIIDVPGYGYAKAARSHQEAWQDRLQHYLVHRQSLKAALLVCDIRRDPRETDLTIIHWSRENDMPLILVLNKIDKLSRNEQQKQLKHYQVVVQDHPKLKIHLCSCLKSIGISDLVHHLRTLLQDEGD
ncbi:ribosome biogenesis GTP-binding protein YihA/YsxC [Gammaproteobacteria bacterium]|nr:ribosome biogenesis GTP-binding protein YihA/YsxC [Gammaproteobacteria bacterium]